MEEPKNCTKCKKVFDKWNTRIEHTTLCYSCFMDEKWRIDRENNILLKEVRIPIENELKNYIYNEIVKRVEVLIKDKEFMRDAIREGIIKYPQFYKDLFKPVIEDAVNGMKLKIAVTDDG